MAFTPPKKEKLTGILAIILYLVTGLLLLFRPDIMGQLTRWTLTIALGAVAVYQAVRYFRLTPAEAAKGYNMTVALIAGTLALLAGLTPGLLTNRMWGILILCGGYMKFQTSWDFYRLGHGRWWWIMVGTAVSLLFGVLIVTEVISANVAVWIGIALLLEAVMDAFVLVMTAKGDKWDAAPKQKQEKKPETEQSGEEEAAPAAPTAAPAPAEEPAPMYPTEPSPEPSYEPAATADGGKEVPAEA